MNSVFLATVTVTNGKFTFETSGITAKSETEATQCPDLLARCLRNIKGDKSKFKIEKVKILNQIGGL